MLYTSTLRRAQQECLPRRVLGGLLTADGRALAREHVLGRDVVDVLAHPADEGLAGPRALVVVRRLEQAAEVLERELGVDRDEPVPQADGRIDALPAPEGVLERVVGGGQHLR